MKKRNCVSALPQMLRVEGLLNNWMMTASLAFKETWTNILLITSGYYPWLNTRCYAQDAQIGTAIMPATSTVTTNYNYLGSGAWSEARN
jgi:hypothetical protein